MSPSRRPGRGTQGGVEAPPRKRPKCPICGKPASPDYRPFCSKHCADIDLGRWLGGSYAVPGEKVVAKPLGGEGTADEEED